MQSWGTQSRFSERDTGLEPSKSGVVGLLCAALGRPRGDPVDDLAVLQMGVRVDFEGSPRVDYQTAGGTHRRGDSCGVVKADGKPGGTVLSNRHYLAGADFLVGLEGERALLHRLDSALRAPCWQLCLGRKAFVPGVPIPLPGEGLRPEEALFAALAREPWPRPGLPLPPPQRRPTGLRFVLDTEEETGDVRFDRPIGAAFANRQFLPRSVRTLIHPLGTGVPYREMEP